MIEWTVSPQPVAYPDAVSLMQQRWSGIVSGTASELVWLLEHPALYTAGISAKPEDLLDPQPDLPIFSSGRGGKYTWHGPGQRVIYLMLDLSGRGRDLHLFVSMLEQWLIDTLADFGVHSFSVPGRPGVWTRHKDRADKLAAIGLKIRKWVCYHGVSLNIAPDLSHYAAIIPCGNAGPEFGVTSLAAQGVRADMAEVDQVLKSRFHAKFGAIAEVLPPL